MSDCLESGEDDQVCVAPKDHAGDHVWGVDITPADSAAPVYLTDEVPVPVAGPQLGPVAAPPVDSYPVDSRGVELGLFGQDLMIYQTGEVVQIGVIIEKALDKWIVDARVRTGVFYNAAQRNIPAALKRKVDVAKALVPQVPGWNERQRADILSALNATLGAMQRRNRVVHDMWVTFDETPGYITRFGYFPETSPGAGDHREITPGVGPGRFTHADWESLRLELWHASWRLSTMTWVWPDPDGTFFFSDVDLNFELIRGDFDLTRDNLILWSNRPPSEG